MGFLSDLLSSIGDFFGFGGSDDDPEEDEGAPIIGADDEIGYSDDFDEEDTEQSELSEYEIDAPEGELVDLPTMSYEDAYNYVTDAPDGVLAMYKVGPDEYEIWRTYEG